MMHFGVVLKDEKSITINYVYAIQKLHDKNNSNIFHFDYVQLIKPNLVPYSICMATTNPNYKHITTCDSYD